MSEPSALMADSTRPQDIPDRFALRPNGVLIYNDGPYKWPEDQVRRFPRCWRITAEGDPANARYAREIDVERFDITPAHAPPYVAARAEYSLFTNIYCNRSTVAAVLAAKPDMAWVRWHIATLDGMDWTPTGLALDLKNMYGVDIDPDTILAIQNLPLGTWDQSGVFGNPGWELTA